MPPEPPAYSNFARRNRTQQIENSGALRLSPESGYGIHTICLCDSWPSDSLRFSRFGAFMGRHGGEFGYFGDARRVAVGTPRSPRSAHGPRAPPGPAATPRTASTASTALTSSTMPARRTRCDGRFCRRRNQSRSRPAISQNAAPTSSSKKSPSGSALARSAGP